MIKDLKMGHYPGLSEWILSAIIYIHIWRHREFGAHRGRSHMKTQQREI